MRWMMRRRNANEGDRGVVTVVVAVLVTFFLLGLGAIVTDVGSWYAERAQVQNGADAGAIAVAQSCSRGACNTTLATTNAPANSNLSINTTNELSGSFPCGSAPDASPSLPACPAGLENGTECPLAPSSGADYVDVRNNTVNRSDSSNKNVPPFLGTLLGGSSNGKPVVACSQAQWGPVGTGTGIAVTFSECTWLAATSNGTAFAPAPPYATWPPPGVAGYTGTVPAAGAPGGEQVLQLHGSGNDCAANAASGFNLPGGFGWLDTSNNTDCLATIDTSVTVTSNQGVSIPRGCGAIFDADRGNPVSVQPTVVYMPIFDGVNGQTYHLAGFAAFVITGGKTNGNGAFDQPSNITGRNYCTGNQRCLYGFFTQGLIPAGTPGGPGPGFGASVVRLTG